MSLNDDKYNYRDMAIKTFFVQEQSDEAAYKKVFDALNKCVPSILPQMKLYRYRSNLNWKHTMSIIEKNEVYLCPLDKQNDPFEFECNDSFGEIVKQTPLLKEGADIALMNHAIYSQEMWNKKCEEYYSYKAKMSIACFCEDKDNLLLWAHYANSNKGICIEYSALDLLQCFQCFLLPVIYQKTLPSFPDINEISALSPYRIAFERSSTKSEIWSYEKEWRIIRCLETTENHCVSFPKPTSVYLGANASKVLANRVLEVCVAKKIPLYKMKPDRYSYSLSEELIYKAPKGANR